MKHSESSAVPPDGSYLRAVTEQTARRAAAVTPPSPVTGGASPELLDVVEREVGRLQPALLTLSHALHAHPETAFAEHRAAAIIRDLLGVEGITAQVAVHGLPTALRAQAGGEDARDGGDVRGGPTPTVAILAEYDALPGIGHGCGHNVIAAAAVGAFLAVRAALAATGTPGRVVLLGTPAEEGGGGKEIMARDGAFEGVDAAMMVHPFSHDITAHPFLGRRQLDVTYRGVAAHAAAQPFMGRNALDAVVAGYQGIAMLRQHLPGTDRVHGTITDGGQRPNVVPERASAQYYLRSAEPDTLADLCRRVEAICEGAAAMTGCGMELTWDRQTPYLPIRHNTALADRYAAHCLKRGRVVLPTGVVPESMTGSTDLGNVSVRVPSIHPMVGIGQSTLALHTVEFAAAAVEEAADAAVLDAAAAMASTALDVLVDPQVRAAMTAGFEAAGGAMDVPGYFDTL